MNVKIAETGKIETLGIIDSKSGVNWVQDLIGNTGALHDGQFVWSEDDNAYIATQGTFDWWAKYISDSNSTDEEVAELAGKLGISESVILDRIADHMAGVNDYEDHRKAAIAAMSEIKEEYA